MALANLTVHITANAAPMKSGMAEVSAAARTGMTESGAAVDDFRARLMRASDDLAAAARSMGANMQAANDAMVKDTKRSEAAVDALVDKVAHVKFDSIHEKMAAAFGVAIGSSYAATKTWLEKTEEIVVARAKILALTLAIPVVGSIAGALYTGYKLITGAYDFIKGLFTGDSYKSQNIDALIAINREVKDLQGTLHISAQEASGLRDALDRLGVSKGDYAAATGGAEKAMRTNGDELDRLGVKYKEANGQLLQNEAFLVNVKKALDEYTVGYDRNAAAAAIGAGTYEQVTSALKITQEELVRSKDRIDEYGLAIGPQTQAYVTQYEQAMREFKHESDLTSQGFKRAIADNIMPILTDLADFFKDGWPNAVRVFRYSMAEVTSLFYGLKTVTYVVLESILGVAESMGLSIAGIGSALVKVVQGDFSGAKDALYAGWEDAKKRFALIGDNIVEQARHNRDAIIQAWGLDDRNDAKGAPTPKGKSWVPPKPKEDDKPTSTVKSPYLTFLEELDRMVKKVEESEYAMLRLKAVQLAAKEGITDLTKAYEKINAVQRGESQKVVDEYTRRLREETDEFAFQTSIMGMTTREQEKFNVARAKSLEVERLIEQAKKSARPLDDQAIKDLRTQAEKTIALTQAQMDQRRELTRSGSFGAKKALDQYIDDATNTAQQVSDAIGNGLKGMEDALVNFVKTGKLSFADLANSVIADLSRMFIRQSFTAPLASFLGLKMFADGGDPPVGVPSIVGERGPELFIPKSAGTIIPNGALSASAGGGNTYVTNQYFTVGDVASMADVKAAVATSERRVYAATARSMNYGGALA